jgi:hypothetical protein
MVMANFDDRRESDRPPSGKKWVYTPYIRRGGKKIWHPKWPNGVFRFAVPKEDSGDDSDNS